MECDGGFLGLELLFRDSQIHPACVALNSTSDLSLFNLYPGSL